MYSVKVRFWWRHAKTLYGLFQLNTSTTHFTPLNNEGNILDLIITNEPDIISGIEAHSPTTMDFPTDHWILDFDLTCRLRLLKTPSRVVYNFKNFKFDLLRRDIQESSRLIELATSDDIDNAWDGWSNEVIDIINSHVPKTKARDKDTPPWFDNEVKHLQKKKESARRRAVKSQSPCHRAKYVDLRRESKKLIAAKHREYVKDLGQSLHLNPKRFWGYFRSKSKTNAVPDTAYTTTSKVQHSTC